jgi:hypothetical protein
LQILPLPLLPKRLNQNYRQANQSFIFLAPLTLGLVINVDDRTP